MRFGIHLPQYGRVATGDNVSRAATHAEELGFSDVWISDHVVHPAAQSYPSPYLLDPFATLSWAAASTTTVGLGTFGVVTYTLYSRSQYQQLDDQLRGTSRFTEQRLVAGGRGGPTGAGMYIDPRGVTGRLSGARGGF